MPSDCTRMALEKWGVEEGWILCRKDGLQCSISCLHFKRGTTSLTAIHRLHLVSIVQRYKALRGGWAHESDVNKGVG